MPPIPPSRQLYDRLSHDPRYKGIGNSYESFVSYFSQPSNAQKLYGTLTKDTRYKGVGKDFNSFATYFRLGHTGNNDNPAPPPANNQITTDDAALSAMFPKQKPVSDATRLPQNRMLENDAAIQKFDAGVKEAVTGIAKARLKSQGKAATPKALTEEIDHTKADLKSGKLSVNRADDGKVSIGTSAGFWDGIVQSVANTTHNLKYAPALIAAHIKGDDKGLADIAEEMAREKEYINNHPYQSLGNLLNASPLAAPDLLLKANTTKDEGEKQLSYNSSMGTLGQTVGGAVANLAPLLIPGAGEAEAGTSVLLQQLAANAPRMIAGGAQTYLNTVPERFLANYQENKSNWLTPESAANKAAKDAEIQGILPAVAGGAFFSGAFGGNTAAKGFGEALGHALKNGAKFSGIMGAQAGAEDFVKQLQGYKADYGEDIASAMKSGFLQTAAMELLPHALSLPKYARSQFYNYINKNIDPSVVEAQLKNAPEGTSDKVINDLQQFDKTKQSIPADIPMSEETRAAITGKMMQRTNLKKQIDELGQHGEAFADKIEGLKKQITNIESDIQQMSLTNKPFDYETDNLTGEPLTPKKNYEDLSGKEKGGIVVPKEYGVADVKEIGDKDNKGYVATPYTNEKDGGLIIKKPLVVDGVFKDKAKAQEAADKALAQHYYDNGMHDGLKPIAKEEKAVENKAESPTDEIDTTDDTGTILEKAQKRGGIYAALAAAIKNALQGVKTTVTDAFKSDVSGNGDYGNGEISINNKSQFDKMHIFFHEAMHHITFEKLKEFEANPNSKNLKPHEAEAIINLKRIFKQVTEKLNRDRGGYGTQKGGTSATNMWVLDPKGNERGLVNVHEFISEAFSNPEFQKLLSTFKGEGKTPNLFKQFLNTVAKILGLKDSSILDDIFHHTEKLLDEKAQDNHQPTAESNQRVATEESKPVETGIDTQSKGTAEKQVGYFQGTGTALKSVKKPDSYFAVNANNEVEILNSNAVLGSVEGYIKPLYDLKNYPKGIDSEVIILRKPKIQADANGRVQVVQKGEIAFDNYKPKEESPVIAGLNQEGKGTAAKRERVKTDTFVGHDNEQGVVWNFEVYESPDGERLIEARLADASKNEPAQIIKVSKSYKGTNEEAINAHFGGLDRIDKSIVNQQIQPTEKEQGITVWHGSPHGFDKFDISKLGSGEGAQAFGHGLYFTSEKGIAEGYANTLSSKKNFWEYLMNGNDIQLSKEDFDFINHELDAFGFDGEKAENANVGNVIVDGKDEYAPEVMDAMALLFGKNARKELADYDVTPEQIDRLMEIKKKISNPKLYKATLHDGKTPEQYDYVNWQEPLSDTQKQKIGDTGLPDDATGKEVYKALTQKLGSQKAASDYLLSKGVDGIVYKTDKGTGGKTGKGRNYVVFDDKAVNVKEINGQPTAKGEEVKVNKVERKGSFAHTKGVFEDSNGNLYKSTQEANGSPTNEHGILEKLQKFDNVVKIGDKVNTNEGEVFKMEKLTPLKEGDKITIEDYRKIQDVANELDRQGIFIGEHPDIGLDKDGKVKLYDFSLGREKLKHEHDDPNYDTGNTFRALKKFLDKDDKQVVDYEETVAHNKEFPDFETTQKGYLYNLKYRPFGVGTFPKEGFVKLTEKNKSKDGHYGTMEYSRPLSSAEIKKFELENAGRSENQYTPTAKENEVTHGTTHTLSPISADTAIQPEAAAPQGQENQSTVSGHPEPVRQDNATASLPVLDDKGVTALHQSLGDKAFSEVLDQAIEESKGEDINTIADNVIRNGVKFHGTSSDKVTDKVLPPNATNNLSETGRKKNLDKVFYSDTEKSAAIYAGRAKNSYGGEPKVYKVIPIGDLTTLNANKGTEVHHSDYAMVLTPELAAKIKDNLESRGIQVPDIILNEIKANAPSDINDGIGKLNKLIETSNKKKNIDVEKVESDISDLTKEVGEKVAAIKEAAKTKGASVYDNKAILSSLDKDIAVRQQRIREEEEKLANYKGNTTTVGSANNPEAKNAIGSINAKNQQQKIQSLKEKVSHLERIRGIVDKYSTSKDIVADLQAQRKNVLHVTTANAAIDYINEKSGIVDPLRKHPVSIDFLNTKNESSHTAPLTDNKQSTSTAAGESKTVISQESTGDSRTSTPEKESSPQAPPVSQTTGAEPTAAKEAKSKPAGKYEAKARQVAEKIKASNISLPDFLKADLPEGTKGAGYSAEDLKNALADAVIAVGKALDTGAELKEAIKEAVKDLVHMQGKENEATILKGFEGYYRQHFIEDEPPTAAPKEEGGNEYTRIHKAALKEDYSFTKNFESKSDQSVANEAMRKLHERAADNGITPQQQAANEVAAMKHKTGEASEHDIVTAAYHLMNLDEQISKVKDDFTEGLLLQQREDALTTLRQLGNNAGRNLRLFSVAYKKVAEGAIDATRRQLRRDLGIEELPKTIKDLEKSNLTAADKKKVRPYVQTIEQLEKDLKDIDKKAADATKDIDDKDLQEAIKKAYEQGKKDAQSFGNNKKKSDKLRDFAKKIRESDTLDKLGLGKSAAGDAQANGFSFNAKEALAKTIELIADGMDKVEAIAKALKESGAKASIEFNELVDTALAKLSLRDKEEVASDIKALAASEQSTTITKEMVQQHLIYDFVKQHIFSDTPYEQVIKNATEELKQYLPDVNEKTVADAFVKRGEFKPETRQQVQREMKAKEGDVKRLALSEMKLRALEAANDIHEIQNDTRLSAEEKKKAIEARKSAYEKGVDAKIQAIEDKKAAIAEKAKQSKAEYRKLETERNRQLKKIQDLKDKITNYQKGIRPESTKKTAEPDTPEIEALKAQAKEEEKKLNELEAAQRKHLRQSLSEQDEIYSLEQEGKRVKAEKTIFANATKSPKKASDALKAARKQMEQAYSEAGIRPEKQNKKDIQIYKESEDAIKEIEQNSALSDDVKKEHIAKITADRDAQLNLTKQGVLINLKTSIDSHVAGLADRIKTAKTDGDTEAAQHLQDIAKDLSDMSQRLKPNGENLKDQIDKADQDIVALIKSSKGTSSESELEDLHTAFVADWQKTYDELQRQQLLKQKESQLRAIRRRFNAGSYSQVESTPFDIQRDKVLAQQDADIKKAYTRLNALSEMAKKDTRPFADKALDVRKQWLIATFSAIEKVAGSAVTKPFIDAGNKQTFGRISGAITGIRPVDVGMVKDTFRQMKNSESAARFMQQRNNAYVDALVNYEKIKAQHGEDAPQTGAALKAMQTAELKHAASLAYLYINAGSHIDIKQIMLNAATDLDASLAKYNKRYAGEMSKWEQVGYWLESVNRTHGAMKSVSARQALLDGYIENLQYFQKKGEPLDVDTRMKAWDMATLMEYEQGRFSEPTQLSNQVAKLKSHDNPWLRRPANFLIPVSKISINIAKQGIDRAIPLEFAWKHWGSNAIKGMKLNAEDGVEFSNFASKYYNGIQRGFNELPLEQKKYINTLMARGMAGLAQYALVGYLLSSGAIKYGGAYNDNDPFKKKYGQVTGADGQPLGNGEWEFGGHRAPKLLNAIINHSPYSMPASLAADLHWQVVRPDGKGNGAKVIGQVLNETYQRLPFATAVDLAKGTVFGDEYKLERTVANVLPTSKGAAELFDKDATTGEARKVDTQGDSFWSKVGKMAMQNTPGLRNLLPTKVAGGGSTTSRSSGRTTSRSSGRSSGRSQPRR